MEIAIAFIIGFVTTWFFFRTEISESTVKSCPNKETISRLAEERGCNRKIARDIREYSLIQIQNGHYEYGEVLDVLRKKEINDKV